MEGGDVEKEGGEGRVRLHEETESGDRKYRQRLWHREREDVA